MGILAQARLMSSALTRLAGGAELGLPGGRALVDPAAQAGAGERFVENDEDGAAQADGLDVGRADDPQVAGGQGE
jgi:hypothetical protein